MFPNLRINISPLELEIGCNMSSFSKWLPMLYSCKASEANNKLTEEIKLGAKSHVCLCNPQLLLLVSHQSYTNKHMHTTSLYNFVYTTLISWLSMYKLILFLCWLRFCNACQWWRIIAYCINGIHLSIFNYGPSLWNLFGKKLVTMCHDVSVKVLNNRIKIVVLS